MKHNSDEIAKCISLLGDLVSDAGLFAGVPEEQQRALLKAAGELSRPDRAQRKKRNKSLNKTRGLARLEQDRRARNATGIRIARAQGTFIAPARIEGDASGPEQGREELRSSRNCYVCKEKFTELHFFYDCMCRKCGDQNYRKRFQTASLAGQVALITGARVKMGFRQRS